jgi:hypothetical protein
MDSQPYRCIACNAAALARLDDQIGARLRIQFPGVDFIAPVGYVAA